MILKFSSIMNPRGKGTKVKDSCQWKEVKVESQKAVATDMERMDDFEKKLGFWGCLPFKYGPNF